MELLLVAIIIVKRASCITGPLLTILLVHAEKRHSHNAMEEFTCFLNAS